MNGNALDLDGRLVHCEHGRRCISRSAEPGQQPEPIVTHFEGKRLNSPNDLTVAPDGAVWFADPTFGNLMRNQGSIVEPELDHRSVYRFDPATSALHRMAEFKQPNGVGFSPDGKTLYVSDTALSLDEIPNAGSGTTHEIIAFDVAEGGTSSHRRWLELPERRRSRLLRIGRSCRRSQYKAPQPRRHSLKGHADAPPLLLGQSWRYF